LGQGPVLDPLLAGKGAIYNQASTTELFGVAIVLLGYINYKNKVQPLKYLCTSWPSLVSLIG